MSRLPLSHLGCDRCSTKPLRSQQHNRLRSPFNAKFGIERGQGITRRLFGNTQPCRELQIVEAIGNGVSQIFFARRQRPLTGFTCNEIGDDFDKPVKATITGQNTGSW